VSISPDKEEVFITVNISEGPLFTVSGISVAGELVVAEPEIRRLITVRPGETFSRSKMQASVKAVSERMGIDGYAFANINAVPEIDRTKNTVAFTFYIDAGRRAYVRKINISGNPEDARRGDPARNAPARRRRGTTAPRIERSKVRVRRLGYFEEGSVNVETPPVPGTTDQVDIELSVAERTRATCWPASGYSSTEGLVFNASVSQQNIFGSGNALALSLNTSSVNRTIALTYTGALLDRSTAYRARSSSTTRTSTRPGYRWRSTRRIRWVRRSASACRCRKSTPSTTDSASSTPNCRCSTTVRRSTTSFVQDFGYVTNSYIVSGGWSRDTRNDILYPTFGRLQSALIEVGLPFGDLAYYKLQYINQSFWPVYGDFVLMLRADLGYGDGYDQKPLPFFKAFYAGGVGSVRGYQAGSLGPRDIYGNTLGGKRKIVGNAEVFYPILKGDRSVRISGFFDAGQIYVNGFQPEFENFRFSAGVGLAWNSPIGPLKFSYAIPINSIQADKIQKFQFQVGTVF
jgi:outer membrane protein insertion porin family